MVNGLWRSLKQRSAATPYQLARLVNARRLEPFARGGRQIVCDIDKTYLETEFESLLRMARIAFEAAAAKVTVAGASDVLLLARWEDPDAPLAAATEVLPRPLHFVSSSPPQLRTVLEEKLMMDGLEWSSDTFKDQAYNLRMGRMDLLRQHVAYKSRAILSVAQEAGAGARLTLIGDNAESDAYIYIGVKLLLEGRLSTKGYRAYLEAAGVEASVAGDVTAGISVAKDARVEAILIRNVPKYTFVDAPPLTDVVQTFDNFYQAALLLMAHGLLSPTKLWSLTRRFHNHHGMTLKQLAGMLEAARPATFAAPEAKAAIETALARLATTGDQDAGKTLSASLAMDVKRHETLDEAEIVRHARVWMRKLAAEKAK